MKNLVIIGASGCGRDMYGLAVSLSDYKKKFRIKGFLDSRSHILDAYPDYPPIIGDAETYTVQPDDIFICAQGDSPARKHYAEVIKAKGGMFITLVSPLAIIEQNVKIGTGSVICPYVHIGSDAKIGDNVRIQAYSNVGHDSQIQEYATLQCYAFTGGFAYISKEATLCTGAKVLPHKKVGSKAFIGAGSIVLQSVKENARVFGVPAQEMTTNAEMAVTLYDIEDILEMEHGVLQPDTMLKSLDCYDSFATLSLIALFESRGKKVPISAVQEWKTVNDILQF